MSRYIELDHIGIILKEEFMEPFELSMNALAKAINVPANRIHGIIHGIRGMTADTDLRLTRYFGLSQGYFLRMQNRYEMIMAKRALGANINKIIPLKHNDLKCNDMEYDSTNSFSNIKRIKRG
ncbi:MAG: HigA family addiction module antitoxin [Leptospirales bacterium]|nr:HigA family addiction module antitoxin [Leptospirales bacterium]